MPGTHAADASDQQSTSEAQARVVAGLVRARGITRALGELILASPEWVVGATVIDTAERLGTSPSSVVRATRRLSFGGFEDLKTVLLRDQGRASLDPRAVPSLPPNDVADALSSALRLGALSITDAMNTVSIDEFVAAVDLLATAPRILLVGDGNSRTPIDDAERRLLSLGMNVSAPADRWTSEVICRQLQRGDVCVVVSRNGQNVSAVSAARLARRVDAAVIAVSGYANSALAREADVNLYAGAPELGFTRSGLSSQLAVLAVFQALYLALTLRLPDCAERSANAIFETTERNSVR